MREFSYLMKVQTQRLLTRKRGRLAVTVFLLIITIAFVEQCITAYAWDFTQLYSAASGWVGSGTNPNQTMSLFFNMLIFPLAALPFADCVYEDRKRRVVPCILSRCSHRSYLLSAGLLSFLSAFFLIMIGLVISQALSFLLFPVNGLPVHNSMSAYQSFDSNSTLLPFLHWNFPYIENVLYIFYASFVAGGFSLISYVLSFFVKRGELLFLFIPTLICFVFGTVVTNLFQTAAYVVFEFLQPNGNIINRSVITMIAIAVIPLLLGTAGLFYQIKRHGDNLL